MHSIDVDELTGITSNEAQEKLRKDGYNELPTSKKRSSIQIALSVIKEPIFLLLVASASIYFFLNDIIEGLVLLSFVIVVMGITVFQERKTENSIDALKNLSSPRALVIRDGKQFRVPGREVVTDDIIILAEGDRVPADALLLSANNLMVDESLLTGESLPVRKAIGKVETRHWKPGGDDQPYIYSGTLITQGQAIAIVKATGTQAEMGKIGVKLQQVERDETKLKVEVSTLVRNFAIFGLSLCALVIIVYGLTRLNWIDGILAGVTLAMAILPEEFPVVLTIFLALGAWRLSKKNVLTKQPHAIENLGSATVLCVDKTGTLTLNKMSVSRLCADGQMQDIDSALKSPPECCHELVEFSVLACKKDPFDPMEKAITRFVDGEFAKTEHVHGDWQLIREYPLSQKLLAMSNVWGSPNGTDYVIAAKGAPEAIIDLCHLKETEAKKISDNVQKMAKDGLRVLGVAKVSFKVAGGDLPKEQHDFAFRFLGLIGFIDPVRPNVSEAVNECYNAGIRVVMITGDYPLTAQKIGRQIGLKNPENIITGPELEKLTNEELKERIRNVNIFARVVPEQKLRIVDAFKANGEIVAMTGDGVNDAPALKSANIGIAMGERGTDVTREAATIVLLDDDFASIVGGVKMGRRIFDNLKKAIAYIFSVHIPIAGLSVLPVLLGWPLILLPVHIVFLEFIIDPACTTVFEAEPEEEDIMQRKPRSITSSRLFNRKTAILSAIQGIVAMVLVLIIYQYATVTGLSIDTARTMAFATIVITNLALIITNRSWSQSIVGIFSRPNKAFWQILVLAIVALLLVIYVPPLAGLFAFSALSPLNLLVCFLAGFGSIVWFEIYKFTGNLKNR
ncbi:cation-translocating P-type ATPase [Candidatus Bathycorpusculum sp.]|uniref:cation-translocating P-type ATPase n=1 Tax=Candidatus Bathycorpusculum sp. TaxID=2994959 RepID=UPI0028279C7B|nr:cation-translocating P-type ATPase [Candidatus Termitimicrobium sp.]MCL2432253.1 cation-translocating P-type ATPase [Candidatus Termitimicrobium sp.]